MKGTEVLRLQLEASFNLVQARMEGVTDEEWKARALPGTSKLGFILWHCARTIDWTIFSALQGAPEVADSQKWHGRFVPEALYGAGIPDAVADRLPDSVARRDAIDYLAEVRAYVTTWFDRQTDSTLDAKVPLRAHQARRAEYVQPEVWAAVASLDGLPAWQFLTRPSISHIRVHVGEYDVLLNTLRSTSETMR
ncbi:MAG: DinB family protein [Candidatus Dormibacteraceae bacterium]